MPWEEESGEGAIIVMVENFIAILSGESDFYVESYDRIRLSFTLRGHLDQKMGPNLPDFSGVVSLKLVESIIRVEL